MQLLPEMADKIRGDSNPGESRDTPTKTVMMVSFSLSLSLSLFLPLFSFLPSPPFSLHFIL